MSSAGFFLRETIIKNLAALRGMYQVLGFSLRSNLPSQRAHHLHHHGAGAGGER